MFNIKTNAYLISHNKELQGIEICFKIERIILKSSWETKFSNTIEVESGIIFPKIRKPEYFGIINKCHQNK